MRLVFSAASWRWALASAAWRRTSAKRRTSSLCLAAAMRCSSFAVFSSHFRAHGCPCSADLRPPLQRFSMILSDADAEVVSKAKIVLRPRMPPRSAALRYHFTASA